MMMIQKVPGVQDLWQCEIFGCYFLLGWGVLGVRERAAGACGRAAVVLMRLKPNPESRAALAQPSPVSCAAI